MYWRVNSYIIDFTDFDSIIYLIKQKQKKGEKIGRKNFRKIPENCW